MAIMRLEVKNYNKAATNAISAHAQYLTERSIAAHAAYAIRERPTDAAREDLVAMGHTGMPAWAQGTEMTYWAMADTYSKANACLGKEILLTLPYELRAEDNRRLVETFLATLPRVPTTWALHAPLTRDGQRTQYHCHILLSPRLDDGQARTPQQYFLRKDLGGVTHLRLYTRPAEVRALRNDWQHVLERAVQEHGLTLERPHDGMKELRLTWQELRHLKQCVQRTAPHAWGHEYRLPPMTITTWQRQGIITARQAEWLAQRGQRQLSRQITQEQHNIWDHTTTLDTARPTQFLTKRQARRGRQRAEATMHSLQTQRHQLSQVYMTWINPALKKEQARYRQAQGRVLPRGRRQEQGREAQRAQVELPALDAALQARERSRQQEMGR